MVYTSFVVNISTNCHELSFLFINIKKMSSLKFLISFIFNIFVMFHLLICISVNKIIYTKFVQKMFNIY